jgi:UDP-N-acetylglucosamine 2-epimerase (non-hydrolysing)
MARSHIIFTDSGGLQEEAPSLGKPLILARDTTERPEAVEAGTVRLVGADAETIAGSLLELIRDKAAYRRMAGAKNPFGDGQAADRIADALLHFYGRSRKRPDEWAPGDNTFGA